ncbi:cytochrome P450 [Luedemannella helvata]|uniref:Cytochrome P450 n=1 Tax=Luedemannella helvata TaxID=349315 RepID=A0ABN2KVN8_9ACTN
MADVGTSSPPRFDSMAPVALDDPYPSYARLRAHGPLCRFEPRSWGVTRHAEVSALLRDPGLTKFFLPESYFHAAEAAGPAVDFFQRMDIGRTDPDVRRVLTHDLSAAASRRRGPEVAVAVDAALSPLLDAAGVDAVADLARPVVLTVLADLIGLPPEVRAEVRAAVDALVDFGDVASMGGSTVAAANVAVRRLREVIDASLSERTARPTDDLLSRLGAVTGDPAVRERAVDNVITLLYAGLDTTTNLIGTGCAALAQHPAQFDRLRAAPAAAEVAVEEFLRFDPPVQITPRMVREPVTIGGRVIRPGRVLILMLGSANRDELVFREPEQLDVLRTPNPHVSFGGGTFFCFGAAQARVSAAVVVERLIRRCAAIEPAGPAVRARQFSFRSYARLPVTFTAA